MIKPKTGLTLAMLVLALSSGALADTFTVTNTNDTGTGSFRQAITDANNHSGLDTIPFNIPGTGVQTITPATALPNITDAVIIDGYTQPGASANTLAVGDNAQLRIQLDGSTTAGNGLAFGPPGGSTVRGLWPRDADASNLRSPEGLRLWHGLNPLPSRRALGPADWRPYLPRITL